MGMREERGVLGACIWFGVWIEEDNSRWSKVFIPH